MGTLRTDPGRGEGPIVAFLLGVPFGAEFLPVPCLDGAPLCGHLELSAGQALGQAPAVWPPRAADEETEAERVGVA